MALEMRQQLKLSQQLIMTPQLQQAIRLLQLSHLELLETVQNELLENPFLEEDASPSSSESENDPPDLESGSADGPSDEEEFFQSKEETGSETDLTRNADWEDYLGDFASTTKQSQIRETELPEDSPSFETRLSTKPSLDGHLAWQLHLSDLTEKQMEIGETIIGNLDSAGYLQASVEEIAQQTCSATKEVEAVLFRIQRFDPVGVAARSPQECLLIQLELLGIQDPIMIDLVRNHLEDLEKKRYKPLIKKYKISMDDLSDLLDRLQALDPLPGASYGNEEPSYVSPDIFVHKLGDEFMVLLNEEGLPHLKVSDLYSEQLSNPNQKDMEYLQEKKRSAEWLIKSLYQRQRTLYKVTESIVRHQRGFFEKGAIALKPLILKEIAEDVEMHESTISRITTNKYVATPHGVYLLKFFFDSALTLNNGAQVGSESVKVLIKQLITEEDQKEPLSDDAISELLKEKLKVNIARRTVAKYRTALGLDSSSKRRAVL